MKKHVCYSEIAYLLGIVLVALGVAFMERADFGVSMVVAPAYVLYRWINPMWEVFSFGMAEYCLQAVLLILMMLVIRRFRISYLFSFVTAVVYGFVLDGCMLLVSPLPADGYLLRAVWYILGMVLCAAGVSMMFHTYVSPEVYELFVKEVSGRFGIGINRFKTCYDCVSCVCGLLLSFLCFGFGTFIGVSWGTIVCALINGFIIGRFSAFYEKHWTFRDAFPLRSFFEGKDRAEKHG